MVSDGRDKIQMPWLDNVSNWMESAPILFYPMQQAMDRIYQEMANIPGKPMGWGWIRQSFPTMPYKAELLDLSERAIVMVLMDLNDSQSKVVFRNLDGQQAGFFINLLNTEIFGRAWEKPQKILTFAQLYKNYRKLLQEEILLKEIEDWMPAFPEDIWKDYQFVKTALGLIYHS